MASLFPLFDRPENQAESTVSDLTERIKDALETDFADVTLLGEVSNLSRPRSGHVYLCLKDEGAQIRAVMWKSLAGKLAFDLTDGLSVRAKGEVTVYATRGEYQLTVRSIEPQGIGALDLAFRQRFARLQAEGLFDADRKRPLPRFPRRIVVVTSPTGAAIRDFLQVAGRRWAATEILVAPTRVQGPGAAEEIAAAIALANRVAEVDFVVVARGGGSLEDLWAFNEEVVARAIAASAVPIVSAVGHEVDVTLADHAADFRALTPSEAGERCLPDAREARAVLDQIRALLVRDARDRLTDARLGLEALSDRLDRSLQHQIKDRRHSLARLAAKLETLSPVAVLARGYSLTFRDGDPAPLRNLEAIAPGDTLLTRLASGTITSRVETVQPEPATNTGPSPFSGETHA